MNKGEFWNTMKEPTIFMTGSNSYFFHGLSFIYLANNFHSIPTNPKLGPWEPEKGEIYLKQKEQWVWNKVDSLVWENQDHTKQGTWVVNKGAVHSHKIYNKKWLLKEWKSSCIDEWDASYINGTLEKITKISRERGLIWEDKISLSQMWSNVN